MLIDSFLEYLRLERNYSERTIVSYETDLREFEEYFQEVDAGLDFKKIDADIVRRWMVHLMDEGRAATSVNRKLSTLRSFYRFLLRRKEVVINPMLKVVGPKKKKPLPFFVREKDLDRLLDESLFEEDLDARPRDMGNVIENETICHHGDSHKLYYYKDSGNFHCYTGCGSMSVFDLVMKSLDMEFGASFSYIARKFNISNTSHFEDGFAFAKVENPGEKLRQKLKKTDMPTIETLSENLLDDYYDLFHQSWLDDGIGT